MPITMYHVHNDDESSSDKLVDMIWDHLFVLKTLSMAAVSILWFDFGAWWIWQSIGIYSGSKPPTIPPTIGYECIAGVVYRMNISHHVLIVAMTIWGIIKRAWRGIQMNIIFRYSSSTRNPRVIWHNFGVTVITSGSWTYGNPHSYRFFQSTNSGSTWNNPQSYAT